MIFLDIENIETENGLRWSDLCMEAPIIKPPDNFDVFGKRKKRQTNSDDTDDLGMVSNKMSVTTAAQYSRVIQELFKYSIINQYEYILLKTLSYHHTNNSITEP